MVVYQDYIRNLHCICHRYSGVTSSAVKLFEIEIEIECENAKGFCPQYMAFSVYLYFLERPWLQILSKASAFSRACSRLKQVT